ncbi:hypothetical protein GV794_18145 [Nocardia cyriacigeorgica]|uniref:Ig-like domain repeat protein n=1 Tax=Nocardia cyriacigeorgica TaxID=135487 RepID=A0A6P1D5C8_9NOCA|nr:hypothetical protein [Nocardia cyriacigeorgica]NEW45826.1 hypothetical protein [Nocardia cyriacigeorgica]NEW57563.1 hypothetical protein [Nocardia cyriacigeorgica]
MRIHIRRFGLAAILGVLGLVTTFAAPGATAAVTGVSVAAGPEGLRAGCAYTVTATVDVPPAEAGEITIINSGGSVPGNGDRLGQAEYHAGSGTATFSWTPEHTGRQNITAQQFTPGQYTSSKYIEVDVQGRGLDAGSSCLPLP